jgi:hypothetical protein
MLKNSPHNKMMAELFLTAGNAPWQQSEGKRNKDSEEETK